MRAYFLCNSWLSGIQKGIQGAHALTELVMDLSKETPDFSKTFYKWAKDSKTMIFLNGGSQKDLLEWLDFLNAQGDNEDNTGVVPYNMFQEDEDSLNECLTAIVIIAPGHICEGVDAWRDKKWDIDQWANLSVWERQLVENLARCRLAR